ncbi:YraN family protein [uncultured Thalassolituus sp.]|uniref:YraN family protein n=1 Tax=uncultured Thalassolituus sp. TaxID=285273 RepID=UPI00262F3CDE|nr:YraN family protein [uncultured Thalassolituus sp.]
MWFSSSDNAPRARGEAVEKQAEKWLKRQGLKAITRNYLIRGGEIDLIMQHGKVLVFVEVRYRRSTEHGSGAETITAAKQRKLRRAAQHYLITNFGNHEPDCRFDVLSGSGEPVAFEWIQNAF